MKSFLQTALFLSICCCTTIVNAQCSSGLSEVIINFEPDENYLLDDTHWEIYDENGILLVSTNVDTSFCLASTGCYTFTIYDDFGDGMAGGQTGYYGLAFAGQQVASGVNFGFSQTAYFGEGCEVGSSCFFPEDALLETVYTVGDGEHWYRFIPDIQASYTISTCGFDNDCNTSIWVYDRCLGLSGTDSQEEAILFNDDACDENQAEITAVFHAGQTYYLRLGDQGDACTARSFDWRITSNGEVSGCTDPLSCNYDPLATIDDGSCLYGPNPNCPSGPDLIVKPGVLANTIYSTLVQGSDGCYISEGCLQGYGLREVVRFTTHIQNVGT